MDNRYQMESKLIHTDVTFIEIYRDHIFAGIGNIVNVFRLSTLERCYRKRILTQHRLHGMRVSKNEEHVAFYGNRIIAIGTISVSDVISVSVITEWNVGDWIWDIHWQNEDNEVLILTANNNATLWDWRTQQQMRNSTCHSKCLLYCGIILEDTWNDNVVVCGTMFQKILIWAPSTSEGDGLCRTLHKLSGHQGAIFSVFYNKKLNRICSTSDDRSIKMWQVTPPEIYGSVVDCWARAKISPLFTIYGHLSRVWKSHILDDGRIISTGEDSQLRIWHETGSAIYHWETHQGASIRSVAVAESQNVVVTGSKDGGISLWPLSATYSRRNTPSAQIQFKNTFGIDCVQDVPRRLILSKRKKLLTVTNKGMVLVYDALSENWDCFVTDHRFASYCLFDVSQEREYVSLASICGTVIVLKEFSDQIRVVYDRKICSGRIYSLQWLSSDGFITCTENGSLEMWKFYSDETGVYKADKVGSMILPPCKERWLTSAVCLKGYLIVGDRDGSVHCYSTVSFEETHPVQSFRKIHSRLGVSFIWCNEDGEICSIGRDGFIRYWNITDEGIEHTAADKLPVKWPSRVVRSNSYGLLVLGFNEVHFEIWSINDRRQLFVYKCGGGHRPWDFIMDESAYFVYIKEKLICTVLIPMDHLVKPTCLDGLHIRHVECVRYLDRDLIISASEDTTLRVSSLSNDTCSPVRIIRSHLSSVKTISCVRVRDYHLVVSGGGRAQLKLWKVYKNSNGTLKYGELASHMLRPVKKCRKPWIHMIHTAELEPRYMDSKIRLVNDTMAIVYVAGSDAVWRVYSFDLKEKKLTLEKETDYSSHCILGIIYVNWANADVIVTLATDGKATFWELSTYRILHQEPIHQNGINSCGHRMLEDNCLALVSGGDDASIIFSVFQYTSCEVTLIDQWKNNVSHNAQVSGLAVVKNYILSTGGDQNVILWKWGMQKTHKVHVELVAMYHSLIPDIHGLDTIRVSDREIEAIVYGAGIQTIRIKLHDDADPP